MGRVGNMRPAYGVAGPGPQYARQGASGIAARAASRVCGGSRPVAKSIEDMPILLCRPQPDLHDARDISHHCHPLQAMYKIDTGLLVGFLLVLVPAAAAAQGVQENPCANTPDHRAFSECEGNLYAAAQEKLKKTFEAALSRVPEADPSDSRKGRAQLHKAQEAWQHYISEHCAFVGGLEGGSNSWVTTFATECELQEMRNRIQFLTHLPQGG